jgi:hypothetical protein
VGLRDEQRGDAYVAIEATTLTSGLLVAFYWDRRALEAKLQIPDAVDDQDHLRLVRLRSGLRGRRRYKKLSGGSALLISSKDGGSLDTGWHRGGGDCVPGDRFPGRRPASRPFIRGSRTRTRRAPTPISVLLSGVMIKMALYAMARTVSAFYRLASGNYFPGRAALSQWLSESDGVAPGRPEAVAGLLIRQSGWVCARRSGAWDLSGVLAVCIMS